MIIKKSSKRILISTVNYLKQGFSCGICFGVIIFIALAINRGIPKFDPIKLRSSDREAMAGQPPGNPSQNRMAKKIPSTSLPKEAQCLARKCYFSRQEIEDHSPSRKDGIGHEEETKLRKLYCSFLQGLGIEFKVPQVTIATAMMLCHRFYMRQSHAKNDWQTIATASMFLACKVEETSCRLSDVAVVAYKLMYNWDPSAPRRIKEKVVYDKWKELILIAERLLLSTIAYDLNIEHPYKPLVAALKGLEISHKDLAKVAWNFVNDWLRTTLCLQYKPHYVAAGSMFLAAKFQRVKLPMEKGKVWWMQFDVSPKLLEEVIQQMLRLLEKNRKKASLPTHGNVNESKPAVSTSICYNPQSGIISGSNVPQNTDHGAAVDTERFVKSTISNSPQSCITSGSNIIQYTGIGARVDDGGLVKSAMSDSPQSCIKSCSNITADARELVKPAISGSPQSGIIISSTVAWDSGLGTMGNDGGLVKSAMSKGIEDEASSELHLNMKESLFCQTSDSGSANSAVEDGDGEPRGVESDQNSSFRIVSVQDSDSKLDVTRIREALKRRRLDRTANKKSVEAMDDRMDGEVWIEWELENGIELKSDCMDKRKRF